MIVVENVGGVDETACGVNMNPINSLLDVEMYMYNVVATCQKMMMLNLYYTSSSLAMEFTTWQDINWLGPFCYQWQIAYWYWKSTNALMNIYKSTHAIDNILN